MSTLEMKSEIFDRLNDVEDVSLLKKIRTLLNNTPNEIYKLTEYEIKMLNDSENDIKNGKLFSNEEVILEEQQWLKM
jgi:hypothetical protein